MAATFYEWLLAQTVRTDAVGTFAKYVKKDLFFPQRAKQLSVYLRRFEGLPDKREACKAAHAEWRKLRKLRKQQGQKEGVA